MEAVKIPWAKILWYFDSRMQLLSQESGRDTRADEANCFFEKLDCPGQGLQKWVSGMCVLLDKLVFNIHRYF